MINLIFSDDDFFEKFGDIPYTDSIINEDDNNNRINENFEYLKDYLNENKDEKFRPVIDAI